VDEVVACLDELFCGDVSCFAEGGWAGGSGSNVFADVGEGRVQAVHLVEHVCVALRCYARG
jgi:hypothetical protein